VAVGDLHETGGVVTDRSEAAAQIALRCQILLKTVDFMVAH
jgi:hypothetical protein